MCRLRFMCGLLPLIFPRLPNCRWLFLWTQGSAKCVRPAFFQGRLFPLHISQRFLHTQILFAGRSSDSYVGDINAEFNAHSWIWISTYKSGNSMEWGILDGKAQNAICMSWISFPHEDCTPNPLLGKYFKLFVFSEWKWLHFQHALWPSCHCTQGHAWRSVWIKGAFE